jgi:tetratricopeptide (TPR) repeat protein
LLRGVSLLLLVCLAGVPALPQAPPPETRGQLDASPTLFYVMAAVNAAGFDTEGDSPTNHPMRKAVRDYLAKRNPPSLTALRRFVRDHRPKNGGSEYGQYVSFALASKGAPDFTPTYPNLPQPQDADGLYELPNLMATFYQEANLDALWQQVRPDLDRAIAQYSEPVTFAVQKANAYLRVIPGSANVGRHFQIYVDLLGPPNQVQRRSYVDDDFVVVTPAVELPIDDIRHAYLRFLIDPMGVKYADDIRKKRELHDYALNSPILAQQYRDDYVLLAIESLTKAVESRLDRRAAWVDQATREGFVLTPAFADLLLKFEKQDVPMRAYFPELVAGIDVKKERLRLSKIDFITEQQVRTYRVTKEVGPPELTGLNKILDEAEQLIVDRAKDPGNTSRAKDAFQKVLEQTNEKPMQAKAYYGLARVAVLQNDPETGDQFFRKVLDLDPDVATKARSLVYIGRLADFRGEKDEAQQFYKAALALPGIPDSARQDAEKGVSGANFRDRK